MEVEGCSSASVYYTECKPKNENWGGLRTRLEIIHNYVCLLNPKLYSPTTNKVICIFSYSMHLAFLMQFLGSGVVQHRTDYGGCLRLLDERKRRQQRRRYKRRFDITITPQCFYAVDKNTKVRYFNHNVTCNTQEWHN